MKASDYLADYLAAEGVEVVFEVVGGMITHMLDSLHQRGKVRIVSLHHEQAAAFAVDGFGRMRGQPVVAMATSGPGATNLLTGIGSCYFDSVPAVFITGQVNRHELRGDRPVRQLGFQETDIVRMAQPITKAAWMVESAADLPAKLREAFRLARSGRPGPVLLDIPMDVQREAIEEPPRPHEVEAGRPVSLPDDLWSSLVASERPLLILGGGAAQAEVREGVRALAERLQVPAVLSLLGNDVLPTGHAQRVGFYGSYGNRWANHAVGRADWLLVLGSRLDIRQTGADVEAFASGKRIFHVDVDPGEMNNRVEGCTAIHGSLKDVLGAFAETDLPALEGRRAWLEELADNRRRWPAVAEYTGNGINPNAFLDRLSREGEAASAYVADVGQHQMWSAQSLHLLPGQRFLTSGGMGAMGYGLPAAIGASLARPGMPVVLVAGDGGFQLNLQELQAVRRNRFPVKMVLLNNQCHGMVRQFQQSYFHERYPSTVWGYDAPDFARVAQAYGLASATLSEDGEATGAIRAFWADPEEPYLLQVMLDPGGNVYPKIAFGHPLTEMEPEVKPLEMEGT